MNLPFRIALLAACLFAPPTWAAFVANDDGTVTDTATGLIWDRCHLGWTWDAVNSTCVDDPDEADAYTWSAALKAVVSANTAVHLGHSDWRLPNRLELESLVDVGKAAGPTIDETAFPNTPTVWFWSSTTYARTTSPTGPTNAWAVYFDLGGTNVYTKGSALRVRLVRSGQSFDLLTVDGACGTAHEQPSLNTPAEGLCSAGVAGDVISNASLFSWDCAGQYGGSGTSCSAPRQFTVTASAGAGGSVDPSAPVVTHGATVQLTVTPDQGNGWGQTVGGDCPAGSWNGNTWTTGAVTAPCSVSFGFGPLSITPPAPGGPGEGIDIEVVEVGAGEGTQWVLDGDATRGFLPTDAPTYVLRDDDGNVFGEEPIPLPPAGFEYPYPIFDFVLHLGDAGTESCLVMSYPEPLPPDTVYWKYGYPSADARQQDERSWYQLDPQRYEISEDRMQITLMLRDGEQGDDDWQANGVIHDPGMPGVFDTTAIPTLSNAALWLLAGLLLWLGFTYRPARTQRVARME